MRNGEAFCCSLLLFGDRCMLFLCAWCGVHPTSWNICGQTKSLSPWNNSTPLPNKTLHILNRLADKTAVRTFCMRLPRNGTSFTPSRSCLEAVELSNQRSLSLWNRVGCCFRLLRMNLSPSLKKRTSSGANQPDVADPVSAVARPALLPALLRSSGRTLSGPPLWILMLRKPNEGFLRDMSGIMYVSFVLQFTALAVARRKSLLHL